MALIIKWNNKAIKHFDEAIEYIQLSSPANAEKSKKGNFISDKQFNGISAKIQSR